MKLLVIAFVALITINIIPFWLLMLIIVSGLSYFWWPEEYQNYAEEQIGKLFK